MIDKIQEIANSIVAVTTAGKTAKSKSTGKKIKKELATAILNLFKEAEDLLTDLPKSHITNGVRTVKNILFSLEGMANKGEVTKEFQSKFYSMIKTSKQVLGQIKELDNPDSFADVEDFLARVLKLQSH